MSDEERRQLLEIESHLRQEPGLVVEVRAYRREERCLENLCAGFVPENGAKSRTILGGSGSPDHCGAFVGENGVKVPTIILDAAG
jgi:hypothetical protein